MTVVDGANQDLLHNIPGHPDEFLKLYRQLQILCILFNNAHADILFCHHAAAFVTQTAANYGTLKLKSKMSLGAWICCPVLAVSGTNNLVRTQIKLGSVRDSCRKVVKLRRASAAHSITADSNYMKKWLISATLLKINHSVFTHFTHLSGVHFMELVVDYTIDFLVM